MTPEQSAGLVAVVFLVWLVALVWVWRREQRLAREYFAFLDRQRMCANDNPSDKGATQ